MLGVVAAQSAQHRRPRRAPVPGAARRYIRLPASRARLLGTPGFEGEVVGDPRFRGRGCWGPPILRAGLLGVVVAQSAQNIVVPSTARPRQLWGLLGPSRPRAGWGLPASRARLLGTPDFEGEVVGDPRFRGRGCWGPPILRARLLGVLAAQSAQHRRPRRPAPLPTSARFRTPPCPEPVPSALRTTPSPRPFWCPAGR